MKGLVFLALSSVLGVSLLSAQSAPGSDLHVGFDPIEFFSSGARPSDGIPAGRTSYLHRFGSDFDSLPGDISSDQFSLFAPILPLSYQRLRVAAFASYRATWFDTPTASLIPDETLHSFRLPVLALYDLSDKWLLGGMAMPGFSGDLSSGSDSFSILTALAVGYNWSDSLKVLAGGLYSHGFDENRVFPGLGFSWRPHDKLSVNILPPFASISYDYNEEYKLSLTGRYDSPTWNVEADAAGPARDVTVREIRVALQVERLLGKNFWIFLGGGATFARKLEVETLGSSTLQESDIDPGLFVQGGMSVRF